MSRTHVEADVVAVHGWGLDRGCWGPLREILPAEVRLRECDRGYFGRPAAAGWSPSAGSRRILLVHSMGILHSERFAREADAVILVSSFVRFHPADGPAARASRRVLGRMRGAMESDPVRVLREFHDRCGVPPEARPRGARAHGATTRPRGASPDAAGTPTAEAEGERLLAEDLRRLDEDAAPVEVLRGVPDRIVLHGDRDEIVPEALGRDLASALGKGAAFRRIDGAGHAIPITHPGALLDALLPVTVSA